MERIDYQRVAPEGYRLLQGINAYADNSSLDFALLELIRLRASQINGCAYCVDKHSRALQKAGVDEKRIHMAVVWWEATCYSERERAALAWTDSVTRVADSRLTDGQFDAVRTHFSDRELVDLTFAVCSINTNNRLAVAFRRAHRS